MLNDKTILITGGTGSFGKQFIYTTLHKYSPKKIIVYSRDEYKQDLMRKECAILFPQKHSCMRYFIGDMRDRDRLYRALSDVDYVIHAAAMKQVPTCEYNPFEAVKTNIHGAQNLIDACIDRGVKRTVALSTDKAVNPINLYGGTKLVSDKLFVAANAYSAGKSTVFSVVRYGNVAGSRGSVIPLFQEIVARGENRLPITDRRMTRFWMTLEQGVALVYEALGCAFGGEIYVSKIPSFTITDLAKALKEDCILQDAGIREGEKLHEIMITPDDARQTYEYDKYYIIYPNFVSWGMRETFHMGGTKVPEGFAYSSDANTQWLSVEDLRKALAALAAGGPWQYNKL